MNIWHDIAPERITSKCFEAYIEIPKGCKAKYELDKDTGLLKKVILFDDIDYVDYKLNVFHKAEAIFLGVGSLIIENKTQKFVIRNIEGVRDCYETIIEAIKEYKNDEGKER